MDFSFSNRVSVGKKNRLPNNAGLLHGFFKRSFDTGHNLSANAITVLEDFAMWLHSLGTRVPHRIERGAMGIRLNCGNIDPGAPALPQSIPE